MVKMKNKDFTIVMQCNNNNNNNTQWCNKIYAKMHTLKCILCLKND